jgi:hypothetical protein
LKPLILRRGLEASGLEMATMWREFGGGVSAGSNDMNRFCAKSALVAVLALGGGAWMAPANAAPPTVTPSPGYDARLQEQRAASTVYVLVAPEPACQPRVRRLHRRALKHPD